MKGSGNSDAMSTKEETMTQKDTVAEIWEQHKKVIPGGVVSLNRVIDPMRVFVKAGGCLSLG